MISLDVPCVITYELKDGKVMAYLKPKIPQRFDFESFEKILEVYNPSRSAKEEEKQALKMITDCLLNIISTKVIKNE